MKTSKYIPTITNLITILLLSSLLFISCTVNDVLKSEEEYRLVTPTEEEISEIIPRMDYLFSMFHYDYDCTKDNIYEYMFDYDHLGYVYPHYDEEFKEFIAEPFLVSETSGYMFWDECGIPENDPLGKFPKIPDGAYDENGDVSEELAMELREKEGLYWRDVVIGHNKFSGEYIDWLVEGVWNGKADHDTFMVFEDETRLYYYDGNYYTPECAGDRGGGVFFGPTIDSITPLEDGKYEIIYQLYDVGDEYFSTSKAVIGMKETPEGFRFWSIYSLDFDIGVG